MKLYKKAWESVGLLNGIVFSLYVLAIAMAAVFTAHPDAPVWYYWQAFCTSTAVSLILSPILLYSLQLIHIPRRALPDDHKARIRFCVSVYFLFLICFFINYCAFYPGIFTYDSNWQYEQAVSGLYNDWHPAIHTLLAFKLPLTLTNGWKGSIVLFQILLFSAVLAYAIMTVRTYTNRGFTIVALLFVLLNPNTVTLAIYPLKDTWFAMGAVLLTSYLVRIVFSKGEWIRSPLNSAVFIFILALTTLFRHNAVIFTGFMAVAVALRIPGKRRIAILICSLIVVMIIKYPLYSVLNVRKPGGRQIEVLGLPMNIIGSVATYSPDTLDDETREFVDKIAPLEIWKEKFFYGNYNDMKSDHRVNNQIIEEYGVRRVLNMAFQCMRHDPRCAMQGLVKLTEPVYSVTTYIPLGRPTAVAHSKNFLLALLKNALRKIYSVYNTGMKVLLPHLMHYFGAMHLVLLACGLAVCKLPCWTSFKRLLCVLPVFAYNFGTMLLLTGRNDVIRFLSYTFLLTPIYFVLFFAGRSEKENTKGDDSVI